MQATIYHPVENSTEAKCHCERNNRQRSTTGNKETAEGKGDWCAVSIVSVLLCAHSTDRRGFIKQGHAPSPPDLLCPPGVPYGEKGDRRSLHHRRGAEQSRIKLRR